MAYDQGKMGNIIGLALMAELLNKLIPEVGTTVFRPPYTPVSIGALAGRNVGKHFRPLRVTPTHQWNLDHGAIMIEAGLYQRPWYFPEGKESLSEAYIREATVVRKTGDGVIAKQWSDAWAYYIGASYAVNENNRLELYAIGAPQRHGQNLWKQNAAAYSHDFAKNDLGYAQAALDKFDESGSHDLQPGAESGRFYSQNWAKVSSSYAGQQ